MTKPMVGLQKVLLLLLLVLFIAQPLMAEESKQGGEPSATVDSNAAANSEGAAQSDSPEKPKKRRIPVPQVEGGYYVQNLTDTNFDTIVKSRPTVVLVASEWCPHCKNYMPDFYILAYHLHKGAEDGYNGAPFQSARYYTANNNNRKDEIMKKFDLDAVPKILVIKDNRYWIFDGKKTRENISAFINELDYDKAKLYPSYVPDFWDETRRFFRDIMKAIDNTAKENPEKIGQFKIFATAVGGIFAVFMVFAMANADGFKNKPKHKKTHHEEKVKAE